MASDCELCSGSGGERFAFHYGNKIGEEKSYVGNNTTRTTTTYSVGGSRTASVCRRCVLKDVLFTLLGCAGISLVAGLVAYLIWSYADMGEGSHLSFLQFLGKALSWIAFLLFALGCLISLGFGAWPLLLGPREWGEMTAIKIGARDLKNSGYDVFWTTRQFKGLQRGR